ncbi:MAG: hypothetical protein AAF841_01710 [Pseudomonadota bacterium]
MFLELIATFAAGFGAAGMALLANMLTGGRLPKWAMPVAAGLAMIGVTIANEYSWGARTVAGLPEGVIVIDEVEESVWYRPWSYVWPQTVRILAVDALAVQTREDTPDLRLFDLYLFARWTPPATVPQLADCARSAFANATRRTLANPEDAPWAEADPAVLREICEGQSDG